MVAEKIDTMDIINRTARKITVIIAISSNDAGFLYI
jgi:hypothetical protein